ncbi:MAG: hypothetical protein M1144_01245, partial [Candidatus Thermoplasmatota archaeon]|nr:hypothetical protein [Candidatus Thermoplasmatota archaeon]
AAAAEYLANAAGVLLTDLGITALVDQAVAALKTVASAMEAALQALLAFVIKEVTTLFNTALQPFYQARNAYSQSVLAALDPTGPEAVWDALGGTLFELGITIAVVIQVAIGILTGVSLGTVAILQQILIGLILTFGITALLYTLPSLTSPGRAMVNSCQTFANNILPQPSQAANWTTWADTFVYWETGASNAVAFQGLREGWTNAETGIGTFVAQTIAFTFGLLGTSFAFYAHYLKSNGDAPDASATTINAFIVTAVSLVAEGAAFKSSTDRVLDAAILGMDATAFGISIAEWKAGY